MNPVKEVCVESYQEAISAAAAGATRIELCENLSCGGTTPSYGTIKKTIEKLQIPVMVMIRPRGGDFCYTTDEFEIMREDIRMCNLLGADGVVFGLLKRDNRIDVERTSELIGLARTMPVTFHKAIDDSRDLLQSVTQLKNIGISRILTSGGQPTAFKGAEMLRKMIETAGDQLKIIVAGKVTFENIEEIKLLIPSDEYHGRRLVKFWAVNYEADSFWYEADALSDEADSFLYETGTQSDEADSILYEADALSDETDSFLYKTNSPSDEADSFSYKTNSPSDEADSTPMPKPPKTK